MKKTKKYWLQALANPTPELILEYRQTVFEYKNRYPKWKENYRI